MKLPGGVSAREWADMHAAPVSSETIVQQHYAVDHDINTILRRFKVTGALPLGGNMSEPVYGDFTGIEDYESAVEKVRRAQEDFMRLPPELREKFGNNPGGLIEYARSHTYEEYVQEANAVQERQKALQEAARVQKGLPPEPSKDSPA